MVKHNRLKLFFKDLSSRFKVYRRHRINKYFDERSATGSINLKQYSDISSPLPDHLNDYEAVGVLVAFLSSENTPVPIMYEKYTIHPSWMKRFDETFFLTAEKAARDFQIMGYSGVSMALLGYCQRVAGLVGRHEYEQRFKDKKNSIVRGRRRYT